MKLGITGHRSCPPDTITSINQNLYRLQPELVNIGGAKGFDLYCMYACYISSIPYSLYLPFKAFVSDNHEIYGVTYKKLIDNALKVSYEANKYTGNHLYMQRNKKIVDNSDEIMCYWNGKPSSTRNTVMYAKSNNKPILNLHKMTDVEKQERLDQLLVIANELKVIPPGLQLSITQLKADLNIIDTCDMDGDCLNCGS
jgi:hypothetical protein